MMTWLLKSLDRQSRLIVMMVHADGLSPAEIATVLDLGEAEVRKIYQEALARIRELLDERRKAA